MVKKINMKERIKRLFLDVYTLLRAGNKNDLCNAKEVKRVFLGSAKFFRQVPDIYWKQLCKTS